MAVWFLAFTMVRSNITILWRGKRGVDKEKDGMVLLAFRRGIQRFILLRDFIYVVCFNLKQSKKKKLIGPHSFLEREELAVYRVSQEECARFREGVPYVKIHRYNPKHLYQKLNGYGDNGQRKVWYSGGSTHCTSQLTALSMSVLECGAILRQFSWFSSECFCAG
jgi:hypothetical protein